MKGFDRDLGHIVSLQPVRAAQDQNAFDRGLGPATNGVGFVVLLQPIPACAQIGPEYCGASSTVIAGAPVKPCAAIRAADTPAIAPQPDPSFSMVG